MEDVKKQLEGVIRVMSNDQLSSNLITNDLNMNKRGESGGDFVEQEQQNDLQRADFSFLGWLWFLSVGQKSRKLWMSEATFHCPSGVTLICSILRWVNSPIFLQHPVFPCAGTQDP